MLEIELKFRADDWDGVRATLAAWAARPLGTRVEEDHYFNAPDRDFAVTDEAFRIRRVGDQAHFTYKGPKRAGATKTRLEIEVPLAPGGQPVEDAGRMLVALGYRPVAVVTKRRDLFAADRAGFELTVCLDAVEGVGRFVELEIVVDESHAGPAQAAVLSAAADLGLTIPEPRSYLRMLLESRAPGGETPG
jgi:adenylate cyclase class 2